MPEAVIGMKKFIRLPYWWSIKPALSFRTTRYESTVDVPCEIIAEGPAPYFATVKLLEDAITQQGKVYDKGTIFEARSHELIDA